MKRPNKLIVNYLFKIKKKKKNAFYIQKITYVFVETRLNLTF